MRDVEQQVNDVKRYYSCGPSAAKDMDYLKSKYQEIKEIVDEAEGKKPNIKVTIFDEIGGGDLQEPHNSNTLNLKPKFTLRLDQITKPSFTNAIN